MDAAWQRTLETRSAASKEGGPHNGWEYSEIMSGPLALVGGTDHINDPYNLNKELLLRSGATEVVAVLSGERLEWHNGDVETAKAGSMAQAAFLSERLGVPVRGIAIMDKEDADTDANVALVSQSRYVYLGGGNYEHVHERLAGTRLWNAVLKAWQLGALIAGESAGALLMTNFKTGLRWPKGEALEVPRSEDSWQPLPSGLGPLRNLYCLSHFGVKFPEDLFFQQPGFPETVITLALPNDNIAVRTADGRWTFAGAGGVKVFRGTHEVGLDALSEITVNPAPA
jgi:hypothetical protein